MAQRGPDWRCIGKAAHACMAVLKLRRRGEAGELVLGERHITRVRAGTNEGKALWK